MPFDNNYKRLGIIIMLFITLTLLYTCEHVFFNVAQKNTIDKPLAPITDEDYYNKTKIEDTGLDVIGFLQFMTFTIPAIPVWMMYFMTPFTLILNVVLAYLIIDIIHTWIPLL